MDGWWISNRKLSTWNGAVATEFNPLGQKFPSPIFEGVFKVLDSRWLKDSHLKLRLALDNGQIVEAIAFNAREKFEFDAMQERVRLVYELDQNEFNGKVSLQLRVIHLEH